MIILYISLLTIFCYCKEDTCLTICQMELPDSFFEEKIFNKPEILKMNCDGTKSENLIITDWLRSSDKNINSESCIVKNSQEILKCICDYNDIRNYENEVRKYIFYKYINSQTCILENVPAQTKEIVTSLVQELSNKRATSFMYHAYMLKDAWYWLETLKEETYTITQEHKEKIRNYIISNKQIYSDSNNNKEYVEKIFNDISFEIGFSNKIFQHTKVDIAKCLIKKNLHEAQKSKSELIKCDSSNCWIYIFISIFINLLIILAYIGYRNQYYDILKNSKNEVAFKR